MFCESVHDEIQIEIESKKSKSKSKIESVHADMRHSQHIESTLWTGLVAVTMYGFVALYPALRLIGKADAQRDSFSSVPWLVHQDSEDAHHSTMRMMQMAIGADAKAPPMGLSVAGHGHQLQAPSTSQASQRRLSSMATRTRSLHQRLSQFLNDSDNCTLFAGYLSQCFCLENLLV